MSESVTSDPVIVSGAGIVGAAAARVLQRAGRPGTLLDSVLRLLSPLM